MALTFQQWSSLLTWPALSGKKEVWRTSSRTVCAMPENIEIDEWHLEIVPLQSQPRAETTRAVFCRPFNMAQNVAAWLSMMLPFSTSEKDLENLSGQRKSPTMTYPIKVTWRPSIHKMVFCSSHHFVKTLETIVCENPTRSTVSELFHHSDVWHEARDLYTVCMILCIAALAHDCLKRQMHK